MRSFLVIAALALPAHAEVTVATNRLAVSSDELPSIEPRLRGLTWSHDDGVLAITDVAGEGAPMIGVVARDGDALVLDTPVGRWTLIGPLARPRIAGPGYTVWVIGTPIGDGSYKLRRLGVLRRPAK